MQRREAATPSLPVPSSSSSFLHLPLLFFSSISSFFFLLLLPPPIFPIADQARHCTSADLLFQYTPCDQNMNRWLFAVPRSHSLLCTPESIPAPKHGLNCSVTCPAGHFLEMHSQQCRLCQPGTFSLGDRVRYEQFDSDKLPEDFSVENSPDESFGMGGGGGGEGHCSTGVGWTVEEGELRYRWTRCVSTLSISLHLTRPGFAEFQYQMSKESRGLIQLLQVRNAQCQSYGNTRSNQQWAAAGRQQGKQQQQQKSRGDEGGGGGADIRVQRLALRSGQNLITWTVAINPVISTRMEMIRLIRLDISGLAFAPQCSPCPAGTFAPMSGAQQCEPCGPNEFAPKGANQCGQCPAAMWAEPRSEFCQPRPACSSIDFYPARPSICNSSLKIYQRKIMPPICRDDPSSPIFTPEIGQEQCPDCSPGMRRNGQGKCEKCPEGQVLGEGGKHCVPCPANSVPESGLFLTQWDSLPVETDLKMECEFLSAEDAPGVCQIRPSWISHGHRLESVQTRMRGVAMELSLHLNEGFHSPLHSGPKATPENPLGLISLDFELQCRQSCQFYVVQEFESSELTIAPEEGRQLQMLALLNGTHARRLLSFPVIDPRPRRILIAFTRSDAVIGKDELTDRAIIYSLNVTNTKSGMARRCVECPRMENGKCRPCPAGEYFAHSTCRRCPPGTILNQTALVLLMDAANSSSSSSPAPCSPCPPFFDRSADGFACEFSGHFDLDDEKKREGGEEEGRMRFDLSALKEAQLSARGIRVFSRDGQSYMHVFNISLFPDRPIRCQDSLPARNQQVEVDMGEEDALFCRSAAIPLTGEDNRTSEIFVSSTIISRKLALVTRQQQFGTFRLSDDQLEYDPEMTAKGQRPLDLHFFFHPMPSSSLQQNALSAACPNGTLAVVTVRCEPAAVAKPLVRLSRRCPDGTCDGCLYHAIVESAHGCPVCTARDYREIRAECINDRQQVHLIPSKHCVLSGAQNQEREEPCRSVLSPNVRLLLALAISMICSLLVLIFVIYRRNRTLQYRYSRLVEGRGDMDSGVRSCALGESDQEGSEEEEDDVDGDGGGGRQHQQQQRRQQEIIDSSRARVFFSNKKGGKKEGGKYSQRYGRAEERAEFIAEEEESD